MHQKILVFFIGMISLTRVGIAQDSLAIGSWESHLPYTTGYYLSQSKDKIIYSTQWSLFTIDKEDYAIRFIDKVNALSDIGIQKHRYDEAGEQLIVIYENSNMDILKGMDVYNIPDIALNTGISGDKQIYNIQVNEDRSAFFSCGFGLVEFQLDSYEFGFTCFTGMPVFQAAYYGNYIVAATADGLFLYDKTKHNNPADFLLWDHLGEAWGLPEVYPAMDLIVWNDHIYLSTGEDLWKAGPDLQFNRIFETDNDSVIEFLNKAPGDLLVGISYVYDISRVLFFREDDSFIQSHHECSNRIHFAELDEQGRIWYADRIGTIRYALNKIYPCESIEISSPFSNNVSDVECMDGKVFIASGGVDPSYTYIYRRDGFFVWNGEKWTNYNEYNNPFFQDKQIYDFFRLMPHPDGKKLFIGTYFAGLLELDLNEESFTLYNQTNSTLAGKTGDPLRERISGLAFDDDSNLWISNFGAPKPISVLSPDGNWVSLDVDSGKDLRDVTIDENGYKWFIIDREAEGFLIYDEGEDLESTLDDRQRIVSKGNSSLESNKVNAIEVDLNGDVWVGTADGPVVFECGSGVFENSCQGSRRKTVLEGIPAYLLDDVNITCIETDGANRKWFGSENGIFVQSPSGEDQVAHFTKENSPLFDNSIIDLAFDGQSGIMYIATAKGVLSYRTETSQGGEKHRGDIYAFPNPVRPDYNGPIAIKGFARDSRVKITDISGQLIHECTALGGQAIWDGYDYSGRRAASGVYLVFASTTDSLDEPETIVTKLLVIRGDQTD